MENIKNNSQEDSKVVAKVNGKEIKRKELDLQIQRIAKNQQFSVPDKQTEERKKFERNVLNSMINDNLLVQDAESQNFQPKEEEIDAYYSALANQVGGEEKLTQALQNMGTTTEQLRKDLANQIMVEQYLNFIKEKNEIVVTEEEVKNFYEKQVAPQNLGVELKTIEPKIRQTLEQKKLNQPLSEIIQNLRKEADISVSL